jgi:hypothetical protein
MDWAGLPFKNVLNEFCSLVDYLSEVSFIDTNVIEKKANDYQLIELLKSATNRKRQPYHFYITNSFSQFPGRLTHSKRIKLAGILLYEVKLGNTIISCTEQSRTTLSLGVIDKIRKGERGGLKLNILVLSGIHAGDMITVEDAFANVCFKLNTLGLRGDFWTKYNIFVPVRVTRKLGRCVGNIIYATNKDELKAYKSVRLLNKRSRSNASISTLWE